MKRHTLTFGLFDFLNHFFAKSSCTTWLLGIIFLLTSCEKFLDRAPLAQTPNASLFTSESNANSAVTGMYRSMLGSFSIGQSMLVLPEFSANHFAHVNSFPEYENFATHGIPGIGNTEFQPLQANNIWLERIWTAAYASINAANNIIENVSAMSAEIISENTKNQFVGEARFIRAWNYFFLVRAFGNVPLETLATSEEEDIFVPQASPEEVYSLILNDLRTSIELLPESHESEAENKGRANRWASKALLAKVELYFATKFSQDFSAAEELSRDVIQNGPFSLVGNFGQIWLNENTSESIFELQFDAQITNPLAAVVADNASLIFLARNGLTSLYAENDPRVPATFPTSATRERNLIGKFPNATPATQNVPLIRLAEIYLIHAEAKARLDNSISAPSLQSLQMVQNRTGTNTTIADFENLEEYIRAIQEEKERELMFEGETWFDYCRTGLALEKYTTLTHENYYIYPIPTSQFQLDGGLVQNPGYF